MKKETIEYPFLRYPRALIDSPFFAHISIEARTLLAMILDRYSLSVINSDRFTDKNGEVYVIYTVEEICEKFRCSRPKATKFFKELENNKLIYRIRTNGSRPSKIYITQELLNGINFDFAKQKNFTLQDKKSLHCKAKNLSTIYNNKSNNKNSNNNSSIIGFERNEDEIKEQIEYDSIVSYNDQKLLDEIVMIMFDVFNGTSPTLRIGKDEMARGIVVSRFCRLDSEHIIFVMSQFEKFAEGIKNIKPYLITLLYNAPATMDSTIAADVSQQSKTY